MFDKIKNSVAWKNFWSAVPAWVLKAQILTGGIAAYGLTITTMHFTGGLKFLNSWGPELIEFGVIATGALQFITKVEKVVLDQGDVLVNDSKHAVEVEIPAAAAASSSTPDSDSK